MGMVRLGMSLKQRVAAMPRAQRMDFLQSLDPAILDMIAREEWFWVARPEQMPPKGDWSICLMLAGRGFGKTRSGAEWIVQRTLDHPYDSSGFPTERLIMAYNISDAVASCAEGPSGVLRVLQRMGFSELGKSRRVDDPTKMYTFTKSPKPYVRLLETGSVIHFTGATVDAARSKNLADVWCVAEGEPVLTERGMVAIERVLPGDRVWTQTGFKEVLQSGRTAEGREVLRIVTTEGELRVTPDHVVWANGGWIRADRLEAGDSMATCLPQMDLCPAKSQPISDGTGSPGSSTSARDTTTAETGSFSTEPSGSLCTDRFPRDSMSITGMGNGGIATQQTLSYCLMESTCVSRGSCVPTPTNMTAPAGPSGPVRDCGACGPTGSPGQSFVPSVAMSTCPPECGPNGARTHAGKRDRPGFRGTSVLSVIREHRRADVYDLTIADAHHFFAGSALVKIHNCDEPIKWANPEETWREGIRPALRADIPGDKPRALVTTTPKPILLLKNWVSEPRRWKVVIIRGSTFDNMINLSEDAVEELRETYEGTALGRQELYGELLDDVSGALFSFSVIHANRVEIGPEKVAHRTVGVDPGLTGDEDGDEMGVIVACRDHKDHAYVIADETTKLAGRDAALHAWHVYARYGADTLVYESNLGKAWMHQVFTDAFRELQRSGLFPTEVINPPLVPVFSNQGKKLRAEPVAMRYSQGRVHHIGTFDKLETQMLTFDPLSSKASPDRLDALVHAVRHLMDGERKRSRILSPLGLPVPELGYNPVGTMRTMGEFGIG